MNALTFDTLKAARRLRDEFGFDERQATGIVETFADGMTVSLDALATRQDLAGFATTAQLSALEESVKAALQEAWRQRSALQNDTEAAIAAARNQADAGFAAVRGEIAALRADLKAEIDASRSELKADIALLRADMAALENRMTIRLGAMIAAAAGFLVVVDKLL